MLRRVFLTLFLLVMQAPAAAAPADEIRTPVEECTALCRDKACQNYVFYGFSADSAQFGYSHLRCPGQGSADGARHTWHVRKISPGKGKRSTSGLTLEGARYPDYFKEHDYWLEELPAQDVGKNAYRFENERGLVLDIELATEEKVAWYFHVEGQEGKRFTYRGEFDEIYFGLRPRVFLSPDGERAAVVMLLDAMIKVDAALVIFSLNP